MSLDRNELRKIMRSRRQTISEETAQAAARQLAENVLGLPVLQTCQHVAGYVANDGEISPAWLAEKLLALGKFYYLPALDAHQNNHLIFLQYCSGDVLKLNRYQIPEPDILNTEQRAPELLDVVLMPLVAFDDQGGRLGMGKGFYDRTFEFIKSSAAHKPLLIGLAYEFQCVDKLDSQVWDVPLAMVVTEGKVYEV